MMFDLQAGGDLGGGYGVDKFPGVFFAQFHAVFINIVVGLDELPGLDVAP